MPTEGATWRAAVLLALASCGGERSAPPSSTAPAPLPAGSSCASCGMAVARDEFAVQCRSAGGELLFFDDPGCLVIELDTGRLEAAGVYFRHVAEERWIPLASAAFERRPETPMGFGYAAVDRASGELTFDEVRAEMIERFELGR